MSHPPHPKTIAVASQKGGAGKTTLATSIADALTLAGEAVLLIDLDPQRSALLWSETPSAVQVIAASTLSPEPPPAPLPSTKQPDLAELAARLHRLTMERAHIDRQIAAIKDDMRAALA